MPLLPKELMKGNIVSYEGRPRIVKGVMDYVILEGTKEWIGASLMNGEPVTEVWMEKFGFEYYGEGKWGNGKISVLVLSDNTFSINGIQEFKQYVHQLQLCYFAMTGQHLPVPKLPKL